MKVKVYRVNYGPIIDIHPYERTEPLKELIEGYPTVEAAKLKIEYYRSGDGRRELEKYYNYYDEIPDDVKIEEVTVDLDELTRDEKKLEYLDDIVNCVWNKYRSGNPPFPLLWAMLPEVLKTMLEYDLKVEYLCHIICSQLVKGETCIKLPDYCKLSYDADTITWGFWRECYGGGDLYGTVAERSWKKLFEVNLNKDLTNLLYGFGSNMASALVEAVCKYYNIETKESPIF